MWTHWQLYLLSNLLSTFFNDILAKFQNDFGPLEHMAERGLGSFHIMFWRNQIIHISNKHRLLNHQETLSEN